tara:strand:- start:558729 stop:559145 length:417 start_codon:yes stop_codon:yes gene_type:complete
MMIYKFKLIFSHPMALAQTPPLARLQMAAFHAGIGLAFLLDPYKVIFACILALILLLIVKARKSPYLNEQIDFVQQRIVLALGTIGIFLMLHADGGLPPIVWMMLSKVALVICFYDAYLAFNGVRGLFYLNLKKLRFK